MQLPNGWLWDMVDEFVYQFQSWQQYVGKLSTKSAEEVEALRSCERVWSVLSVLNYLQALVDHSGIVKELSKPGKLLGLITIYAAMHNLCLGRTRSRRHSVGCCAPTHGSKGPAIMQ